MRKSSVFLLGMLLSGNISPASGSAVDHPGHPHALRASHFSLTPEVSGDSLPIPSKEEFINAIFHTVVDSSFPKYYLSGQAYPCSFVKYDYDEWMQYALLETVPIELLNGLAKNSYYDRKPACWEQEKLTGARCISEEKADTLLNPAMGFTKGPLSRQNKKALNRRWELWFRLAPEERTVFHFSRPEFTNDGLYAILDMDERCDARQCGIGATCLFRNTGAGWKLVGKKINWGSK
jgi:hypothetical protein